MDKIGLIVASSFSLIIILIASLLNSYFNDWYKQVFGKIDITTNIAIWLITGFFIFVSFWSVR